MARGQAPAPPPRLESSSQPQRRPADPRGRSFAGGGWPHGANRMRRTKGSSRAPFRYQGTFPLLGHTAPSVGTACCAAPKYTPDGIPSTQTRRRRGRRTATASAPRTRRRGDRCAAGAVSAGASGSDPPAARPRGRRSRGRRAADPSRRRNRAAWLLPSQLALIRPAVLTGGQRVPHQSPPTVGFALHPSESVVGSCSRFNGAV